MFFLGGGGGIFQKIMMAGFAIIVACLALEMAKATLVDVFLPLVPWLVAVGVILTLIIILRVLHHFLS